MNLLRREKLVYVEPVNLDEVLDKPRFRPGVSFAWLGKLRRLYSFPFRGLNNFEVMMLSIMLTFGVLILLNVLFGGKTSFQTANVAEYVARTHGVRASFDFASFWIIFFIVLQHMNSKIALTMRQGNLSN